MRIETPPHEWHPAWRYGAALVNGLAWAFLWFGLEGLGAHPVVFAGVTILLVSPVLAFLGRGWADLGGILGAAVGISILLTYALVPVPPALLAALAVQNLRAWLPSALVGVTLYALRRRYAGF